jgi:hypothetical protein
VRRRLVLVLLLAVGALAAAQGREDYLLEHEDTVFREAEGLEARANVLFRVMERRLTVLEYHHRESVRAKWGEYLKKDKWLGDLAEDSDARMLQDYNKVLRQLLYMIDDGFAWNKGPTMSATLSKLKKRGEAYLAQMDSLLTIWKPDADARAAIDQAQDVTRKAMDGAAKGLGQIDSRR